MRSSSCRIDIAAHAQRLDVDNRLSLRIYFRIADNILRQANIFRNEKNIIDLYVMLLRFSSLISETIPRHRDYRSAPQSKKNALRKQLLNALKELEELKPVVKKKIDESDRKSQVKQSTHLGSSHSLTSSIEFPTNTKQSLTNNLLVKTSWPVAFDAGCESSKTQQQLYTLPLDERFRRFSVSIARPNEETLSKHSILGPNGLRGQWQPPVIDKRVWYPNNIDTTPVEFPRLHQIADSEDTNKVSKDTSSLEFDKSSLELIPVERDDNQKPSAKEQPMILFEATDAPESTIVKQPSPPPVLAEMQDLIPEMPPPSVIEVQGVVDTPSPDGLLPTESPMELHISASMMDTFMRVAISNTVKNLETCGVLAGSLKNRKFYVTALIIPKQESTSDSCQTTNEEEIFEVQDKQSLFPLGWIHTHPTQSCFMSSIDVHTHYSYQVMLPEAVAIVMAPKDSTKTHGIFRLTNPGGMTVIRHCDRRGFHPHEQPADGGPIYRHCTDVYLNPSLKFDVIDLR